MTYQLPDLPFPAQGMDGFLSADTLHFHHDLHFKTYLDTAANLSKGTEFEDQDLVSIMKKAEGPLQKNAAQAVNHDFYFKCITPDPVKIPQKLEDEIKRDFGSVEDFYAAFQKAAVGNFGSGWTWLVQKDGKLSIVSTSNAGNPLCDGFTPLMCVDVWEHAYYLDFQNRRADYVKEFLKHVNWEFAASNLK